MLQLKTKSRGTKVLEIKVRGLIQYSEQTTAPYIYLHIFSEKNSSLYHSTIYHCAKSTSQCLQYITVHHCTCSAYSASRYIQYMQCLRCITVHAVLAVHHCIYSACSACSASLCIHKINFSTEMLTRYKKKC